MTHTRRAIIGSAIAVGASIPLLLYVIFGPKNGNPVGLGLLMLFGWLVGVVLIAWGAIGIVISQVRDNVYFNDTTTTEIYPLSLHAALPISQCFACAPVRNGRRGRPFNGIV